MGDIRRVVILWCLVLAMCLLVTQTKATIQTTPTCCTCPYTVPNVTVEEREQTFRDLTKQIWNQKVTLSCLGQQFKTIILQMSASLNTFPTQLATVISYKFLRLMPYLDQKPSLCGYSQFINASAKCNKENDEDIQAAVDLYAQSMFGINFLAAASSRFASGCDGLKCNPTLNPKVPTSSCYREGRGYAIDTIWEGTQGADDLVDELHQLVLKLYISNNHTDRLLAAISTYSQTTSGSRLFAKTNWNIIIESIKLQLSAPVRQCCCSTRLQRIDDLYKQYNAEIVLRVKNEKSHYEGTKCVGGD
nr:LAN32-like protein [Limnephilus flavicornis]